MNWAIQYLLFCLCLISLVLFVIWASREILFQMKVCPIWSRTLNALMDADVEVSFSPSWTTLGNVQIYTGGNDSEYGRALLRNDNPDRATQKRLKEYFAYKYGSMVLKQAIEGTGS
jgi:hypothetical protein